MGNKFVVADPARCIGCVFGQTVIGVQKKLLIFTYLHYAVCSVNYSFAVFSKT